MARVFTITAGLENLGAMKTGGQGSVYKGRRIGEVFSAIKILPTPIHSESAADKNFMAFQNEVQKLKKVNEKTNPNVVKIISSGITDSGNLPYIEMDFIEGPDLQELVQPPHTAIFTIKEAIKVAEQLSGALAHCHQYDVKHGDIKSNNVKFNIHTGNYVLLDFGLAIMSDEQRRSSLRHAGAIEFMAPEQNDGQMLFETDVYSFGVVLFELLAGRVPFPLNEKGETARNLVMVAHMENQPPNLLAVRSGLMPVNWSATQKQAEMQVPNWLEDLVYKCLEKQPSARFKNGMELQQFINTHSVLQTGGPEVQLLQQKIAVLQQENERLKKLVNYSGEAFSARRVPSLPTQTNEPQNYLPPTKKESNTAGILIALLLTVGVIAAIYYFVFKENAFGTSAKVIPDTAVINSTPVPAGKTVIEQYIVTAEKAYFYNQPNESTRRAAYAIASSEIIKAYDDSNDFIYTELINTRGQMSKGWLMKSDLVTLADWTENVKANTPNNVLTEQDISVQLNEARLLLNLNKTEQAVDTYEQLAEKGISEAQYQYANLALLGRHNRINCNKAFAQLEKLGDNGYPAAKKTVGFIYAFAADNNMLEQYGYTRCNFVKDVARGGRLLMEAMVSGDTSARKFLDVLNTNTN